MSQSYIKSYIALYIILYIPEIVYKFFDIFLQKDSKKHKVYKKFLFCIVPVIPYIRLDRQRHVKAHCPFHAIDEYFFNLLCTALMRL